MRLQTASAIFALIWTSIPAPAGAEILQPIGNWQVDYGDTQCTAARPFGAATAPVTLGVVPSVNGASFRIVVSQRRPGPAFAQEYRGTLDFGRGPAAASLLYYGGAGVNLSVYQARVPSSVMAQSRNAASVTLTSENGDHFTFPVSDMGALLDSLAKCTASLQQYWNITPKPPAHPASATVRDLRSLIAPADFPSVAMAKHQQGTNQYQLMVDEKGVVAGCDVLASSGVPVLDSTGCEVLKEKARFTAARDASGKAIRSVVTTPLIVWNDNRSDAFDSGCSTISGNSNELISMCGRAEAMRDRMARMAVPPPPPPPTKH